MTLDIVDRVKVRQVPVSANLVYPRLDTLSRPAPEPSIGNLYGSAMEAAPFAGPLNLNDYPAGVVWAYVTHYFSKQ